MVTNKITLSHGYIQYHTIFLIRFVTTNPYLSSCHSHIPKLSPPWAGNCAFSAFVRAIPIAYARKGPQSYGKIRIKMMV